MTCLMGIGPKGTLIAQQEFKLANFDITVKLVGLLYYSCYILTLDRAVNQEMHLCK